MVINKSLTTFQQNVTNKDQQMFVKQDKSALLLLNNPGHKNVIRLIDTFRDESSVYLIYEYADGGELWEVIKHCGSIFDELAISYILQILDGLEYIHSKGLVHRDLKCENIVISNGTLKIIDFGTSVKCDFSLSNNKYQETNKKENNNNGKDKDKDNKENKKENEQDKDKEKDNTYKRLSSKRFEHYVGTPNFMDPQSLSNKDTGFKRDLWSLGCLIYQILCGRPPFYGSTEYFILKNVKDYNLVFPPSINPVAADLITSLLNTDPKGRPDFSEVRSHPFLSKAQDSGNLSQLENMCKVPRKICHEIGKMLIDLEESRSPETSEEFNNKFKEYINLLKAEINENNKHVMNRLIDLMYWHLEETKRVIVKENQEADRWLS